MRCLRRAAPQYCSVKPLLGIIDNDISRGSAYFLSLTEQYWAAPTHIEDTLLLPIAEIEKRPLKN